MKQEKIKQHIIKICDKYYLNLVDRSKFFMKKWLEKRTYKTKIDGYFVDKDNKII